MDRKDIQIVAKLLNPKMQHEKGVKKSIGRLLDNYADSDIKLKAALKKLKHGKGFCNCTAEGATEMVTLTFFQPGEYDVADICCICGGYVNKY